MTTQIAYICYSVATALGIVLIPLALVELMAAIRRTFKRINPIVQETCWLCHRVLGDEVRLYHLAKNTHRVICPKCASEKRHAKHVEHYSEILLVPDHGMGR